ncbi:hypothetical protein G7Z17_g3249 [Cylindrodendrum hubeiense]|uniref:Transcription factor domain-containing protein n=1 Tax=Cylindrodendrum hubeiense TaxID=595255 RepID=A0A9P5HID5_9HYPO|nr:hypothetical protein G7Z17_g3249 [Cylindrodendrum hubeiense]
MAGRTLLPKPSRHDSSSPIPPPKRCKRDRVAIACERKAPTPSKRTGYLLTLSSSYPQDVGFGKSRGAHVECRYPVTDAGAGGVIAELQAANQGLRGMLDALCEGSQHHSFEMLLKLRAARNMDDSLGRVGLSDKPFQNYIQDAPFDAPSIRRGQEFTTDTLPIARWTRVSSDDEMLTHLLTLFWTWDNTLTRIVDRGLFFEGMCDEGSPKLDPGGTIYHGFCSELLVNAMLAVSTIYNIEGTPSINSVAQGRAFADEALRLLEPNQQYPSLPRLQGVALLWAYEETFGNPSTAAGLLEQMFELHATTGYLQNDPALHGIEGAEKSHRIKQAMSFIAWGFYGLDAKISLSRSRSMRISRPVLPKPFRGDQSSNTGFDSLDDLWFPYPVSTQPRLSYHKEGVGAECAFAELAERALLIVEEDRTCPVPDYIKTKIMYNGLLSRKGALSKRFKDDRGSLPTKVFLQISFDMLAIKLLEPFTRLSFLEFDGGQTARSLSFLHSDSIISALWNYRTAFGVRLEYWMVQACQVAALAVVYHLSEVSSQEETFRRSCELLHDVGQYMPLANQILAMIKSVIVREDIEVSGAAKKFLAGAGKMGRVHIKNVRIIGAPGPQNVVFDGKILRIED